MIVMKMPADSQNHDHIREMRAKASKIFIVAMPSMGPVANHSRVTATWLEGVFKCLRCS